jgi:hypothetical protein
LPYTFKNIRPKGIPGHLGFGSENAAHRFAVEWTEGGIVKQGVYIPRRDTSSYLNAMAGGRLFPGRHYKAKFNVNEQQGNYNIGFKSSDGTTLSIKARETALFSKESTFDTLATASAFYKNGCLGYTPSQKGFDGVTLHTYSWHVQPLEVDEVQSSYFENELLFPKGCVVFDNALLMKNIEHEWQTEHKLF